MIRLCEFKALQIQASSEMGQGFCPGLQQDVPSTNGIRKAPHLATLVVWLQPIDLALNRFCLPI
jgi:hypothetical protein